MHSPSGISAWIDTLERVLIRVSFPAAKSSLAPCRETQLSPPLQSPWSPACKSKAIQTPRKKSTDFSRVLSGQWERAVRDNRKSLERNDIRQISTVNTWPGLETQIQDCKDQDMMILLPAFRQIRAFTEEWICPSVSRSDMSIFVGIIRLAVKVSVESLLEGPDANTL